MTQYYQIRPKPEHNVPVEQWGAYGVITEPCPGNHDYVFLRIDDWQHVHIRKEVLFPVFEEGLARQLDRLFDYDQDQGDSAPTPTKPSPQPLNESVDAPVEPSVYDDVNARIVALEKRICALEFGGIAGRTIGPGGNPPWIHPGNVQWTSGGITFDSTTVVLI